MHPFLCVCVGGGGGILIQNSVLICAPLIFVCWYFKVVRKRKNGSRHKIMQFNYQHFDLFKCIENNK